MTYNIKGTNYPIAFNFNTVRTFCRSHGLKTINDFDKALSDLDTSEVTIEAIELRMDLILHAIKEGMRQAGKTTTITIDDLFAELTDNPKFIDDMMMIFAESQPKPVTAAEPEEAEKKSL